MLLIGEPFLQPSLCHAFGRFLSEGQSKDATLILKSLMENPLEKIIYAQKFLHPKTKKMQHDCTQQGMVASAFNSSTWESEIGRQL